MAQRTTKVVPAPRRTEQAEPEGQEAAAREHITKEEIDEMLDEIDSVLEENAEEFVRAYVQKGGQ